MGYDRPMNEAEAARIEELRTQLDEAQGHADDIRDQLHEAIRKAFAGKPPRGVLAEVARRSRWSREYIAQIRDGKAAK